MTLTQLIAMHRSLGDDKKTPALWSSPDITIWLNEAQRQAAFRARLLIDTTVEIAVKAGNARYVVGYGIWIRRAQMNLQTVPLAPVDYRDLDRSRHGWQTQTGTPERYVRGLDSIGSPLTFRPYPTPVLNDTAKLIIVREPLDPMADGDDEPEIESRWHEDLVHWSLFRGYARTDADTYDTEKALKYYERFEDAFGTREAAIAAEAQLERERANRMVYADGTF